MGSKISAFFEFYSNFVIADTRRFISHVLQLSGNGIRTECNVLLIVNNYNRMARIFVYAITMKNKKIV